MLNTTVEQDEKRHLRVCCGVSGGKRWKVVESGGKWCIGTQVEGSYKRKLSRKCVHVELANHIELKLLKNKSSCRTKGTCTLDGSIDGHTDRLHMEDIDEAKEVAQTLPLFQQRIHGCSLFLLTPSVRRCCQPKFTSLFFV